MELEANKAEFIRLLKSTQREGVDYVIEDLEEAGFFQAPASSTQHLNTEGGLVQHSLNTCKAALMLREQMIKMDNSLQKDLKEDSCIIASLLHDVCKTNIYKRTIKKRKNEIGIWEDCEGYKCTYADFPMGHGEKSVVMLLLSGLFTPTRSMPHLAYLTTYINPMHYFVEAIRMVYVRGGGLNNVAHQIVALLAIGMIMGAWAVRSYKKRL